MIIHKSYKFRLKPTEKQVAMLKQHGGNTRFTWNKLLEWANDQRTKNNRFPNCKEIRNFLSQLKKNNEFIKVTYSQPLQTTADRLADTCIKTFKPEIIRERNKKIAIANAIKDDKKKIKKLAKALNFGFPKFKSKKQNNDSIFYPQNFIVKRSRMFFPKMGWINYIKHREIEGTKKNVTITQDGNQWYASITCEVETKEKQKPE